MAFKYLAQNQRLLRYHLVLFFLELTWICLGFSCWVGETHMSSKLISACLTTLDATHHLHRTWIFPNCWFCSIWNIWTLLITANLQFAKCFRNSLRFARSFAQHLIFLLEMKYSDHLKLWLDFRSVVCTWAALTLFSGVSECIAASVRRHVTSTQWITHYLPFPAIVSAIAYATTLFVALIFYLSAMTCSRLCTAPFHNYF